MSHLNRTLEKFLEEEAFCEIIRKVDRLVRNVRSSLEMQGINHIHRSIAIATMAFRTKQSVNYERAVLRERRTKFITSHRHKGRRRRRIGELSMMSRHKGTVT